MTATEGRNKARSYGPPLTSDDFQALQAQPTRSQIATWMAARIPPLTSTQIQETLDAYDA